MQQSLRFVYWGCHMSDSKELEWFNEPVKNAHEFEVDLNCLVVTNHRLTLDAITRAEDE